MSHFAYTRSVWTSGTVLYASEMAELDAKTFKSINGDDGGTWAPSSVITIGGSGVTLTMVGASTAEGFFVTQTFDSAFGSNAYFRGSTQFRDGSTSFVRDGASWTFQDGSSTTFLAGATFTVESDVSFSGVTTLGGHVVVNGPLDLNNVINAGSSATISLGSGSYLDFSAGSTTTYNPGSNLNIASDIKLSGAGSIVERVVFGTAANSTFSSSTADLVYVPNSIADGHYQYRIDSVGAVKGKKMRICLAEGMSSGVEIAVIDDDSSSLLNHFRLLKNEPGKCSSMDIHFINGQWRMTSFSPDI